MLSVYIFAMKGLYRQPRENLFNNNTFSTRPNNMVNFGRLMAEIGYRVWGTSANCIGFRVLASILHRRRSTEVNQTLQEFAVSWAGTLCMGLHFRGLLSPNGICQV